MLTRPKARCRRGILIFMTLLAACGDQPTGNTSWSMVQDRCEGAMAELGLSGIVVISAYPALPTGYPLVEDNLGIICSIADTGGAFPSHSFFLPPNGPAVLLPEDATPPDTTP